MPRHDSFAGVSRRAPLQVKHLSAQGTRGCKESATVNLIEVDLRSLGFSRRFQAAPHADIASRLVHLLSACWRSAGPRIPVVVVGIRSGAMPGLWILHGHSRAGQKQLGPGRSGPGSTAASSPSGPSTPYPLVLFCASLRRQQHGMSMVWRASLVGVYDRNGRSLAALRHGPERRHDCFSVYFASSLNKPARQAS